MPEGRFLVSGCYITVPFSEICTKKFAYMIKLTVFIYNFNMFFLRD